MRHSLGWKVHSLTNLPPGNHIPRLHLHNTTAYALTMHEQVKARRFTEDCKSEPLKRLRVFTKRRTPVMLGAML